MCGGKTTEEGGETGVSRIGYVRKGNARAPLTAKTPSRPLSHLLPRHVSLIHSPLLCSPSSSYPQHNTTASTPSSSHNTRDGDPLVVRDIALARALLRASLAVLRVRQRDFLRHFR